VVSEFAEAMQHVNRDQRDRHPEQAVGVLAPEEDALALAGSLNQQAGGHGDEGGHEGERAEQAELEITGMQAGGEAGERRAGGGGLPDGAEDPGEGDQGESATERLGTRVGGLSQR
jgi:hypothetical protein